MLGAVSLRLRFFTKRWVRGLASAADSNVLTSDRARTRPSSRGPPQQPRTRLRLPPPPPESSGVKSWVLSLACLLSRVSPTALRALRAEPPCPFPPRLCICLTARFAEAPLRVATQHLGQLQGSAPVRAQVHCPESRRLSLAAPGVSSPETSVPGRVPRGPRELLRAPGSAGGAGRGSLWARRALPAPAGAAGPSALRPSWRWTRCHGRPPRAFLPQSARPPTAELRPCAKRAPPARWAQGPDGRRPGSQIMLLPLPHFRESAGRVDNPGRGRVSLWKKLVWECAGGACEARAAVPLRGGPRHGPIRAAGVCFPETSLRISTTSPAVTSPPTPSAKGTRPGSPLLEGGPSDTGLPFRAPGCVPLARVLTSASVIQCAAQSPPRCPAASSQGSARFRVSGETEG